MEGIGRLGTLLESAVGVTQGDPMEHAGYIAKSLAGTGQTGCQPL